MQKDKLPNPILRCVIVQVHNLELHKSKQQEKRCNHYTVFVDTAEAGDGTAE